MGTKCTGDSIFELIDVLFPILRSITGDGVRKTLNIISESVPMDIHEVPTGTKVFDWTVPKEWNIKDAYIKNMNGEKIVDIKNSNLHVLNYSIPVNKKLSLGKLKSHLFTLEEQPDLIPYRTSYYKDDWGFCLTHNQLLELEKGEYEVLIDSTLKDGHLTYGEIFLKGKSEKEVVISAHLCHPSLANDNLSGVAVASALAKYLIGLELHYSYRFLFMPATIGAITWLALNEQKVANIEHGLIAVNLGDSGSFTYKKTRNGRNIIDEIVENALKFSEKQYDIKDFSPYGYDERQFCSPGFDLPFGCLTRTLYGEYPEYHTSADNLEFIQRDKLLESYHLYKDIIEMLENNRKYVNLYPKCEPQLGKSDLYAHIGGASDVKGMQMSILWILNLSDGDNSLLDISKRSGISFKQILEAASLLESKGLIQGNKL